MARRPLLGSCVCVWVASAGQLDERGAQEAHRPTGVIIMTTGIVFEEKRNKWRKKEKGKAKENDGHEAFSH